MTVTATRSSPPGGPGGPLPPPGSLDRKKAVRRYFKRTPQGSDELMALRILGFAAFALLFAACLALVGMYLLGLLMAGGAIVLAVNGLIQLKEYRRQYAAAEPKPSPQTMDDMLKEDLRRVADHAMSWFGLTAADLVLHSSEVNQRRSSFADQGRGPLVVFGPAAKATGRSNVDGVWRFTAYDVLVACPTAHHLSIYVCTVDLDTGKRRDVNTHEYHYAHVVAILTRTQPGGERAIDLMDSPLRARSADQLALREFQIAVASNDRSKIVVGVGDDDQLDRRVRLQDSNIDNVVSALRHTLRERGGGADQ